MSGTTTNLSIPYPTSGDNVAPLETVFQDLAEGVDDGVTARVPGAWTTWAPTYSNITPGNGTVKAAWVQIGKTVHLRYMITWGTTTSFPGTAEIYLPVAQHADYAQSMCLGHGFIVDSSAGSASRRGISVVYDTAGRIFFVADDVAGQTVVGTVPFTWASGDILSFTATYEAA